MHVWAPYPLWWVECTALLAVVVAFVPVGPSLLAAAQHANMTHDQQTWCKLPHPHSLFLIVGRRDFGFALQSVAFDNDLDMVWRTLWITVSTCFLLGQCRLCEVTVSSVTHVAGTTFTHWVVDHNVLWTSPTTSHALERSITYYSLINSAPEGLGWTYMILGISAIWSAAGRLSKVLKGGQSEVLFDGGSVGRSTLAS